MALIRGQLELKIKTLIKDSFPSEYVGDSIDNDKINEFSNKLSTAIHEYLSGLQITILPGEIVVAGSPATQTNPGPIILTLTPGLDID